MEAAVELGDRVAKLAMYEPPYNDDPEAQRTWAAYIENLTEALASGRRGDAIALFMAVVRAPAEQIEEARKAPFWAGLEAVAPTLAYDHTAIMGDGTIPNGRAARVHVPTLVMAGGKGAPFMRETAGTLSEYIPAATLRTLVGQAHDFEPTALAPILVEFFRG
jgi:pimeloyl-ACP methyl ester carboxylesterase